MEKIYRHSIPGYTVPLWLDGKPIKTQGETGKSNAIFKDTGNGVDRCGIFRTNNTNVEKAIEQTKAFKKGAIVGLQSPEEIKMESQRIEQEKFRTKMIGLAEDGLFDFNALTKKKQKDLHDFAKDIGVQIATSKGSKKNEDILDEIKKVLYPPVPEKEEK